MNKNLISIVLASVIFLVVGVFLIVLYRKSTTEAEVILNDNSFEVTGMYGETFNYDDVSNIELRNTIPDIITKTNGAGIGEFKKGNFKLEELGECKLYIHSDSGPFVLLKVNDIYVIINFEDSMKTETLYDDLIKKLDNLS